MPTVARALEGVSFSPELQAAFEHACSFTGADALPGAGAGWRSGPQGAQAASTAQRLSTAKLDGLFQASPPRPSAIHTSSA